MSAVAVEEVVPVEAAAPAEAPAPAEAAPRSPEPAAEQKKPEAAKPKKTLFKLWLDLAFGRKD